jgi:hypothetical protein
MFHGKSRLVRANGPGGVPDGARGASVVTGPGPGAVGTWLQAKATAGTDPKGPCPCPCPCPQAAA